MRYSRRELVQMALVAVPGAGLLKPVGLGAFQRKADSRVNGVLIGLNVPYSLGGRNMAADKLLEAMLDLNVSGAELRTQPVETFMGGPQELIDKGGTSAATLEPLTTWRLGAPMEKARAFRKMYNDAGILLEIIKVDGIFAYSDAALDYVFTLAKELGARALSTEIAEEGPERLGKFADKHGMMVGYHGHAATGPEAWEKVFTYAKHNGANLDIGHFVAGNHGSPIPFLKEHHDRITHIHVKDRGRNDGPAVPFGTGDVPIVEVLQLIRDNKWPIQATIEFEYKVPEGSDRMAEIRKSVEFCRKALA